MTRTDSFKRLREGLERRQVDAGTVLDRLRAQRVETPSWGYGNSGTRFGVFPQPGVPRTAFEKFEDAAQVHRHTGICPGVAIHIPWDVVDDYGELKDFAGTLGLHVGAINPNLFQDEEYKFGSVCHPDEGVRRKATDHLLECIEIGRVASSNVLSVWLADGTNYPGQDSFRDRRHRMVGCLSQAYEVMPASMEMLVEYKFFEPAFYHTDLSDWGSALMLCQRLGERAKVLVDLGHHPQGTNIEHIVSLLLDERRLGGFHFNNRKYADDDLIVGSVNPFELFLIFVELAPAEVDAEPTEIAYMIDQSHNIEAKIEAMILSIMNLQEAYAKALIVDRASLEQARADQDVLRAHSVLLDAFNTDVRPLCAYAREQMGASPEPISEFRNSGYMEKVAAARVGGDQAGWG
jgi:L-rhamnose isomerase / sugar isomerase